MESVITKVIELICNSSEPALVANSDARVIWANDSARKVLSLTDDNYELGDIFRPEAVRVILGSQSWCEISLENLDNSTPSFKRSALAIALVGPDPDDEYFLIIIRTILIDKSLKSPVDDELSAVAHDLKNPLGAIFGYSDALIDTNVGSTLNNKQREIISRIRSTAARSLDLVRNIQQLSQLKSANSYNNQASIDLNLAIKTVLDETWREDLEHPQVKLELAGGKLLVNIEKLLIERVISNLFTNALKFTPADGIITLRTKNEDQNIIFEINNNLPIIPPNELVHIFDRHMRGTTSRGTSGSGLGLYIVFQILQRAAGNISVTSKEPDGTTFRIVLPSS